VSYPAVPLPLFPPPAIEQALLVRLVVFGAPRTKKTGQRIVDVPLATPILTKRGRIKTSLPKIMPSVEYLDWEKSAIDQLFMDVLFATRRGKLPIRIPVRCEALFFRDARIGDASNYYQAVGDMLQKAGVIADDRLIAHWDGSRLCKSRRRPRVVISLFEIQEDLYAHDED